jgi:hypothetical protein
MQTTKISATSNGVCLEYTEMDGRSVWLRLERLPVVASWWSHEAGAVCDGACRIGVDGPAWNDEYLPDCANSRPALRTMPDGWARSALHY